MTPLASSERDENDRPSKFLSFFVRHPGNPQAGIHPDEWPRHRCPHDGPRLDSRLGIAGMTEGRKAADLSAPARPLPILFSKKETP